MVGICEIYNEPWIFPFWKESDDAAATETACLKL